MGGKQEAENRRRKTGDGSMEIKGDQEGALGGWLGTIERAFKGDFPIFGGN